MADTTDVWLVIRALFESEIDAGVETLCNVGIEAWIVTHDGRVIERTFPLREFDEIGGWLDHEARQLFPSSLYARSAKARA